MYIVNSIFVNMKEMMKAKCSQGSWENPRKGRMGRSSQHSLPDRSEVILVFLANVYFHDLGERAQNKMAQ